MVYIHSTCASTKNPEKCMVGHVSRDAAQCRAFEATRRVGGMYRR